MPVSLSSSSSTVAATVTATNRGNLIVAAILNDVTRNINGVTDGTTGFVQATNAAGSGDTGGKRRTDIWYLLSANAGATTITATYSGAVTNRDMAVWEVQGALSWVFDIAGHTTSATGASNIDIGASITTTWATGFIAACIQTGDGIDASPAAGNEFTTSSVIFTSTNAACALISTSAAAHQPRWHDLSVSIAFGSSVAAFGAVLPNEQRLVMQAVNRAGRY